MGRRQRGRKARSSPPGRSDGQGVERQLGELEQGITLLEECADRRLPVARRADADPTEGPAEGKGRTVAQGLAAARARLAALHERMEALEPRPELAPRRPRRGGRFRRDAPEDSPTQPPGARLVAVKLSESGAPSDEVDEYLHEIFTLDDQSD